MFLTLNRLGVRPECNFGPDLYPVVNKALTVGVYEVLEFGMLRLEMLPIGNW